jgi:hypothetical protein
MGERVILSNDPIPREIGVVKTIGTRKVVGGGLADFGGAGEQEFYDWVDEDDDEDDARIDAFLES